MVVETKVKFEELSAEQGKDAMPGATDDRWCIDSMGRDWKAIGTIDANHNGAGELTEAEAESYAKLFAASPELYRELDAILAALENGETVTIEPGSVKAASIASAIAKANG